MISPEFNHFKIDYLRGKTQAVFEKLPADLETPVSASLKLQTSGKPFALLESVIGGERRGRYSIIALEPDLVFEFKNNQTTITERKKTGWEKKILTENPMDALKNLVRQNRFELPDNLPEMAGSLVGYMSYEASFLKEKLVSTQPDNLDIPHIFYIRPRVFVIFDNVTDSLYLIYICTNTEGTSPELAYDNAKSRIASIKAALSSQKATPYFEEKPNNEIIFLPNQSKNEYFKKIARAKEYMLAGDIFQVVLSLRFEAEFMQKPFSLYRSLRHLNPSPFLFYFNTGEFALVGSSPEVLVRLKDETVTIRPIAGTRKRGKNAKEDSMLAEDLLSDPKEISEHLMLLDLGRNDVGMVAKANSVKVTESMKIEHYSHVMHIVSNVEGQIKDGLDSIDALFAGFPAGTVSGAPKIRAMEIINELEPEQRGFYAGTVGYFAPNGNMDSCIALRTALVKDNKLYIQAGGGVVVDSTPEGEYEECFNKARALMRAAELANGF